VNTAALPECVPTELADLVPFSEDAAKVFGYLHDKGGKGGQVSEIASATTVNERNARQKAEDLAEKDS